MDRLGENWCIRGGGEADSGQGWTTEAWLGRGREGEQIVQGGRRGRRDDDWWRVYSAMDLNSGIDGRRRGRGCEHSSHGHRHRHRHSWHKHRPRRANEQIRPLAILFALASGAVFMCMCTFMLLIRGANSPLAGMGCIRCIYAGVGGGGGGRSRALARRRR